MSEEMTIPIQPVSAKMELAAITASASISKVLVTAKSQEDRERLEAVMTQILDAHLNAIGMQVGMLIKGTMVGHGEMAYGLVQNHLQGMLSISSEAFTRLSGENEAKVIAPPTDIVTP